MSNWIKTRMCHELFLIPIFLLSFEILGATFNTPGNFNPIVPGYFADPTIEKFGDTYYLYATTDGNGGGRGPATGWLSKDFVNWVLVPMNWPTTPHYWAPDVVKRPDTRYYLFYNQPCNTFGGVSDSPLGPWTPLTPGDGLVIKDHLVKDVITLDTQIFEDTDGTLYGYWGTWGIFPKSGCGWGVFNSDMKSFARLGMIPNTQAKDFFEAPFMLKRNGVYYFTYSSGSCHDASYRVQYAVGDKPDGEFKMGTNNPILASTSDGKVHGPGHHSILQQGEDYYIVYHRHDIPVTPNGMHRQTCVDRMIFESDGVIKKIEPTHHGIGYLGPKSRSANLAFAKKVSASSWYHDTLRKHEYKPEFAVDDNNATLWRPGDNRLGHWLTIDLGRPQPIRRTETQFEYGTWYYQYLIESSLDGQIWKTFADRRQNTRWGSPMVDEGETQARYLRLTVTGTEFPGLFGAVWNFKAYKDAPSDPLLAMADKAFDQFIVPKQKKAAAKLSGVPAKSDSTKLLIHLDVAALQLGSPISVWTNQGSLGGEFKSRDAKPFVDLAAGRKAVRFSGKQVLTASFLGPRSLAGNSSYTVAMWVNNPQIAESECLISWAGRGGPDGATAQFGYGTHRGWGAVGHWGFADMGFRGALPKAGDWHHIAVTFDGVIERLYVDGQFNHSAAKMLMMHEGRAIHVGASEPGSEYYDGYLASLRVYDAALPESQVKELVANAPEADVLVHVDSAKLDYGPLKSWANNGSLGGTFVPEKNPPVVSNIQGRIAVQFPYDTPLILKPQSAPETDHLSILATVWKNTERSETPMEIFDENSSVGLDTLIDERWHQVAVVFDGKQAQKYVDGEPWGDPRRAEGKIKMKMISVGSPAFIGAIARAQIFRRSLSGAEISQLHALWKQEWQTPQPSPAAFAQKPTAICPTAIAMTAQRGQSDLGPVEYRFTRTAANSATTSTDWTPNPFFLDDGLQPNARYAYTVTMRDPLGNVTAPSPLLEAVTDPALFMQFIDKFDSPRDFLAQGASGTIWDGFLTKAENSAPEAITANKGIVRLSSKGTVWDGGKPLGAFLFKLIPGDFMAQVKVVDYAGLSTRKVPGNNDGGLMVRVPRTEDAGPGEDLVQLNFFPIWNQGNMVTTLDGGRSQKGNGLAWNAHRHLQIIRQGTLFYFRASPDGQAWKDMPGFPVERKDMTGIPLQVGLFHASYGAETSYIDFTDFQLIVSSQSRP